MRKLHCSILLFALLLSGIAFGQPKEDKTKFAFAEYLIGEENYSRALPILLELSEQYPDELIFQYSAGLCYLELASEKRKAIAIFERLVSLNDPEFPDAKFFLGKAYHLNNRFDDAIEMYRQFGKENKLSPYEEQFLDHFIQQAFNAKKLITEEIEAEIINMGAPLNSAGSEYVPVINAEETVVIYTYRGEKSIGGLSDRKGKQTKYGEYHEDILVSYKIDGEWTEPASISEAINSEGHDASIALSIDGQTLFIFKSTAKDRGNLYYSNLEGSNWSKPKKIEGDVNSNYWEGSASLSIDRKTLYFASDRPGGYGQRDLYSATLQEDGTWGEVKNLGPTINTPFNEDAPFIHPDNKSLYYSSEGHTSMGGYDIFYTSATDTGWLHPKNLGYPLNTTSDDRYYLVTPDGERGYFSSGREGGAGENDIYMVSPGAFFFKPVLALVIGEVKLNDQPVEAELTISERETDEQVAEFKSNASTGNYVVSVTPGQKYKLAIEVDGVDPFIEYLDVESLSTYVKVPHDFNLYTPDYLEAFNIDSKNINTLQSEIEKQVKRVKIASADTIVRPKIHKGEQPFSIKPKEERTKIPIDSTYIAQRRIEIDKKEIPGVYFKLEIAAVKDTNDFDLQHFSKYGDIQKKTYPDGITRYTMGNFNTLEAANNFRDGLVEREPEAASSFVTVFVLGEKKKKDSGVKTFSLDLKVAAKERYTVKEYETEVLPRILEEEMKLADQEKEEEIGSRLLEAISFAVELEDDEQTDISDLSHLNQYDTLKAQKYSDGSESWMIGSFRTYTKAEVFRLMLIDEEPDIIVRNPEVVLIANGQKYARQGRLKSEGGENNTGANAQEPIELQLEVLDTNDLANLESLPFLSTYSIKSQSYANDKTRWTIGKFTSIDEAEDVYAKLNEEEIETNFSFIADDQRFAPTDLFLMPAVETEIAQVEKSGEQEKGNNSGEGDFENNALSPLEFTVELMKLEDEAHFYLPDIEQYGKIEKHMNEDGTISFSMGRFKTYKEAEIFRRQLVKSEPKADGAHVVAYLGRDRYVSDPAVQIADKVSIDKTYNIQYTLEVDADLPLEDLRGMPFLSTYEISSNTYSGDKSRYTIGHFKTVEEANAIQQKLEAQKTGAALAIDLEGVRMFPEEMLLKPYPTMDLFMSAYNFEQPEGQTYYTLEVGNSDDQKAYEALPFLSVYDIESNTYDDKVTRYSIGAFDDLEKAEAFKKQFTELEPSADQSIITVIHNGNRYTVDEYFAYISELDTLPPGFPVFTVEIGSSENMASFENLPFLSIYDIRSNTYSDDIMRFSMGAFRSQEEADAFRKALIQRYPSAKHAETVVIANNQRYTLDAYNNNLKIAEKSSKDVAAVFVVEVDSTLATKDLKSMPFLSSFQVKGYTYAEDQSRFSIGTFKSLEEAKAFLEKLTVEIPEAENANILTSYKGKTYTTDEYEALLQSESESEREHKIDVFVADENQQATFHVELDSTASTTDLKSLPFLSSFEVKGYTYAEDQTRFSIGAFRSLEEAKAFLEQLTVEVPEAKNAGITTTYKGKKYTAEEYEEVVQKENEMATAVVAKVEEDGAVFHIELDSSEFLANLKAMPFLSSYEVKGYTYAEDQTRFSIGAFKSLQEAQEFLKSFIVQEPHAAHAVITVIQEEKRMSLTAYQASENADQIEKSMPGLSVVSIEAFLGKDLNDPNVYASLVETVGNLKADNLIFRVQIGAYRFPENYKYPNLTKFGDALVQGYPDQITRFTMGEFESLAEAEKLRAPIIKAGQKDAWIVAFYNGERMFLQQLIARGFFIDQPSN